MHNVSNLFYFGTTLYMFRTVSSSIIRSLRLYVQHHVCHTGSVAALYMFRTVSPSIIRSLRLYIQYQVYVTQFLRLLASGNV